jgi:hypothetical protein
MVDIDSETLFNAAAALVATIAVVMFVTSVDLGYSPVSEAALVVTFLAGVFAITQRSEDYQLILFGYAVVVTALLALFFDLVGTFDVGSELTVLGLLVLAALLFGLRTRLDAESHFVSGRRATYGFVAVGALAAAVVLVDVATGGIAYELQYEPQIELVDDPRQERTLGTVTATNPTPFPEPVETPNYAVCAAGNWSEYAPPAEPGRSERPVRLDAHVDDGYNEHVLGFSSKTYPIRLHVDATNLSEEPFPVERTERCPDDESGDPFVALFERSDDDPSRYAL